MTEKKHKNENQDGPNVSRREHCLNLYVSYELKERVRALADKYDRPVADIIRSILKVGIPMMEGMSQAEQMLVKEYIALFRRLKQVKALKDI